MSFNEFIYEQGIISMMIGTITGFAVSNFMKEIKNVVLVKLIKKIHVFNNVLLLASFIEFLLMLLIVYIMYHYLLYPIFSTEIKQDKKEQELNKKWRKELLHEIKNLDMGTVYI